MTSFKNGSNSVMGNIILDLMKVVLFQFCRHVIKFSDFLDSPNTSNLFSQHYYKKHSHKNFENGCVSVMWKFISDLLKLELFRFVCLTTPRMMSRPISFLILGKMIIVWDKMYEVLDKTVSWKTNEMFWTKI